MRRVVVLLALLLLLALAAGCSGSSSPAVVSSSGQDSVAPGAVAADDSAEAAQNKLRLAQADPCYTSPDPRSVWLRCGRWVEETASTARTAANALPGNPAVTAATGAVLAAHDTFVSRGCPASGPAVPVDTSACIGALLESRRTVTGLRAVLGVAG